MSIIFSADGIDAPRFLEAARRVAMEERLSEGFSVLAERAVHKTVKLYIEPNAANHEVPVLGSVADILNADGVTEVQTGSFAPLLPKLRRILPEYRVTLVHPFPIRTAHRWLNRESGEISSPTRRGSCRSLCSVGRELYRIRELIGHENLTVKILAYECEEFRALDGWDRTGKRGATLLGRLPTDLVGELVLRREADYLAFLPDGLASPFTQKEFMRAAKSRSRYDAVCVRLLEHLGLVRCIGKQGRAFLYERL